MVVEWKVLLILRDAIQWKRHLKLNYIAVTRPRKSQMLAAFAGILIREGAKTRLDQEKQEQQMVEEQSRTCHANKRYTMLHVALIVIVKS